uniref:Prefoldin subunit 5 n=1 Tax=Eucampia antarctica TaxID=49252 RepID=A0A7S2RIW7_9STRA|mmetsp:Transcript_22841/g.21968  ORF Transcript_22841/g.21968 Transcript_22841/m.21968 type:complete len:165 (+) Transcript_22841:93-587(+)|eukprot:CAMPEP_0197833850 /NCGR_PEP_ID=MMETSP1437-20131217/20320_1 /TAXON_ID=49252 ORGANISM="Eucampia antarctica, Strain CCMP1452" /NCGR_SAMPLE_ID=MMETSP1437 /ASSEMBLY_ACC=CAM_ASM_001096 /LENGTH=164 /DNA_ID=CAMNT_0043438139 /DNA_START=85 /DNA_END=579 /DNA_ORIENTATION=+
MSSDADSKGVNLDSMTLEQLNQIKQSEESRLQAITNHYATLRASAARFGAAKEALTSVVSPAHDGKDIMIPLTESLYAPGKIKDPNRVMVELGTGFYAEKCAKDAISFLDRKSKLVDMNSDNIMKAITVTRGNVESINTAMQGKLLEIRARSEGNRSRMQAEQS